MRKYHLNLREVMGERLMYVCVETFHKVFGGALHLASHICGLILWDNISHASHSKLELPKSECGYFYRLSSLLFFKMNNPLFLRKSCLVKTSNLYVSLKKILKREKKKGFFVITSVTIISKVGFPTHPYLKPSYQHNEHLIFVNLVSNYSADSKISTYAPFLRSRSHISESFTIPQLPCPLYWARFLVVE